MGELPRAGMEGRVRGGHSASRQASNASKLCWRAAVGCTASGYLMVAAVDGGRQPQQ